MKKTVISIAVTIALIVIAFLLTRIGDGSQTADQSAGRIGGNVSSAKSPLTMGTTDNVSINNGAQIVEIRARVGYFPRTSTAQAQVPTVINMITRNTFDCSLALTIPGLGYQKILPSSGTTEIPLPPQKAGTRLLGICTMGMYGFEIAFE